MSKSKLERLHTEFGQSPWLDNLRRSWITHGELSRWVDRGIRGLTSNPSIFQKSISQSTDYDEQFSDLIRSGSDTEAAYWDLVTHDIVGALDALKPVYDSSGGLDGFVSVEVDPGLARDTAATLTAARKLNEDIARPNLMVKIPGTAEGLPAIRTMIGEGRSVNVTLIFSVQRYCEVAEAYIAGLEDLLASQQGGPDQNRPEQAQPGQAQPKQAQPGQAQPDLSNTASVASFFISRIDTEVDQRLETLAAQSTSTQGTGTQGTGTLATQAAELAGQAAIASGRAAYQSYSELFSGPRWEALAAHGARPQRPLWASTSTKNPAYPDTQYVDQLIGPNTVNTMPDDTLAAFIDHGSLAHTIGPSNTGAGNAGAGTGNTGAGNAGGSNADAANTVLSRLADVGVDLAQVCDLLEMQGVSSFEKSFGELLDSLQAKALELA